MKARMDCFKSICGNYTLNCISNRNFPQISQYLEHITKNHPVVWVNGKPEIKKCSLSRFLIVKALFDADEVSKYIQRISATNMTVSIRFKDLLAAVNSKHVNSCFSKGGVNCNAIEKILDDPTMAVCFSRDKAGHILWRAWIRVVLNETRQREEFVLYPLYGNGCPDIRKLADTLRNIHNSDKRYPSIYESHTSEDKIRLFQPIDYYDDMF